MRLGPELEKAEQEVANYREFVRLCDELVMVNQQLCRLRPAQTVADESELATLKKRLQQKYSKRLKRRSAL